MTKRYYVTVNDWIIQKCSSKEQAESIRDSLQNDYDNRRARTMMMEAKTFVVMYQ